MTLLDQPPHQYILSNGVVIPSFGLGTYRLRNPTELKRSLNAALSSGYRMIDTAQVYRNEAQIGCFLEERFCDTQAGITRKDVFIVTKLAPRNQGFEACYAAILESLKELKTEYIDLFLIHWPGAQGVKRDDTATNAKFRSGSWKAIEKAYSEGKLRSIGVSNYTISHLKELLAECSVKPQVLQVEMHPFYPQHEIRSFCASNHIQVMAYSSFGEGSLLDSKSEAYTKMRDHFEKNLADALNSFGLPRHLLHWGLDSGAIVIPKSSCPERIASNIESLNVPIDRKIQDCLNSLLDNTNFIKFCWDPETIT